MIITILLIGFYTYPLTGQCFFQKEKDPFTGVETISTVNELVGAIWPNGQLNFKLVLIMDKDTTFKLYININRLTVRCFGPESKISIKCGPNIFNLKLSGVSHCGTKFEDYSVLSLDTIRLLGKNKMTAIRVFYTNDYEDFKVDSFSGYFFKSKLKCFEKKYPQYFN